MIIKVDFVNIFISGITGKVGKLIAAALIVDKSLKLVGGSCSEKNINLGKDIALLLGKENIGINITHNIPKELKIDAIIDFSSPDGSVLALQEAIKRQIPILIGTTGFNEDQLERIKNSGQKIPVLFAPNTSQGIALLKEMLLKSKDSFTDVKSLHLKETHHAEKKDSPSGTALDLQKIVEEVFPNTLVSIESIRKGNNPGEHKLIFSFESEDLQITHKAKDRNLFSLGALKGIKWLSNKDPGLYSMQDIYS